MKQNIFQALLQNLYFHEPIYLRTYWRIFWSKIKEQSEKKRDVGKKEIQSKKLVKQMHRVVQLARTEMSGTKENLI